MPPTGTRIETHFSISFPPKLIRCLPPLFAGISIPFLTSLWIGGAPIFWILPGKAVLLSSPFFVIAAWFTSGDPCTLLLLPSLGSGRMVCCPPESISLGVRIRGYTLYNLLTCWLAPFLTTVLFFCLFPFQNRLLVFPLSLETQYLNPQGCWF